MNFLKKTLGKEEPKKEEKSKAPNTTLPLRKNKQIWSNVDEMLESVNLGRFSVLIRKSNPRPLRR